MKQETGLKVLSTISAEISERILPSVEKVAKKQAASAFAGEFYSSNDHVSHSISVAVDSQPRLKLTAWRYNGTDVLEELERFWGQKQDVRLVPNELYGKGKAGFTGISGGHAWQTIDALRYGNVGLEHFVFGLDDTGSATSLQAVALRGTLPRLKCG